MCFRQFSVFGFSLKANTLQALLCCVLQRWRTRARYKKRKSNCMHWWLCNLKKGTSMKAFAKPAKSLINVKVYQATNKKSKQWYCILKIRIDEFRMKENLELAPCLKIPQNVAFEFFPSIFVLLKVTCLVTLFDRKFQVFKNSSSWPFLAFLNELF